jgi:hypothetical protein
MFFLGLLLSQDLGPAQGSSKFSPRVLRRYRAGGARGVSSAAALVECRRGVARQRVRGL